MGVARYNRGTKAIREQFAMEAAEHQPGIERRELRLQLDETRAELRATREQYARAVALLRRQRTRTIRLATIAADTERRRRSMIAGLVEALGIVRKQWRFASWVIRWTLTPEQFHDARADWERTNA